MEYSVLGPLEVRDGDRSLQLGGAKQRALLAVLLLNANDVVSVDRLVNELWGERPPATAVSSLQVYVSRLRRTLGAGRIETRPPGYLIRVASGELDLDRFEELVARGDGDSLRQALGLWRGEPLADFSYEAFAQGPIARLGELRMTALERRIETDLATSDGAGLVAEIDDLVRTNPLREHLRALQLLALYRAGRQADALAAYRDARSLLMEELGLEPSEELQRLERQILMHDPALGASAPPAVEAPAAEDEAVPAAAFEEVRKLVTILYVDAAPETADVDPEDLRSLHARSEQLVAATVDRHGGTLVHSAAGEGTVVFGVPAIREDDALRAVRAAFEIRGASAALGTRARIGVASGEVIVDGPASVAGVPVAVAKRLAEAAAPDEVLIGGPTLALSTRSVDVEQVPPLELQGGTAVLGAFRVLRIHEVMEPQRRMQFVGREREVAAIRDAWERAAGERICELVTVIGDAGIGKSRLAAEALAPLDAPIVQGRCLPYGEGITYWPVVEVLRQLDSPAPPQAAEPIRALLGESHAPTSPIEVAWAFRKTLEHAAADHPLVVVFDDLQWGEDAFLDLVEETALLSSAAILIVCLARPELLERRPAWPARQLLEPLTNDEIEELLPSRLADQLRDRITSAAGGNPLFVQEMLAVAGDADGDLVVPPTLQAVLAARIDQLDPDERAILTCGAIEGETFHQGGIEALAAPESSVAPLLAGLARKGLIRPDRSDLPGEDGYRFRHILIRDAAYATLPRARRSGLHAVLADWLLATHASWSAGHPDLLAYHYLTALDLAEPGERADELKERAVRFSIASGERAADLDPVAAIASFERALTIGIDEPREQARIQLELGFLLDETGRLEESQAIVVAGLRAAAGLGERGLAARARVRIAHQRLVADPAVGGDEVVPIADGAIETLTELGDPLGLARAERLRAMGLSRLGRTTESYTALERALGFADQSGDAPTRRYVIGTLCYLLCDGPAPVDEAIVRCEELRDSCHDDPVLETLVSRHLCHLLAMAARFDESEALLPNVGSVYDELNQVTQHGLSRDSIAEARELLGDPDGAEQELQALLETFRRGRGGALESRALRAAALLALMYADQERWDEAAACAAYGAELPPPAHFRPAVVLQLAAEARLDGYLGDHAGALAKALGAVELAERSDRLNLRGRAWIVLAQVRRDRGEPEADDAAATALRVYETKGNVAAAAHLRSAFDPA